MQEPSKDNSGDKIYLKQKNLADWSMECKSAAKEGQPFKVAEIVNYYNATAKDINDYVLDEHGHLVVKHDLFSHPLQNGLKTPDGIAEAFMEFAKKEKLNFFL
ncbi:hypothetical protein [Rickettsiella endosymbiont of Dermanyssus gallinae]|uniref:hypothetical protein n=1 Tax=Rickettsiella endosymbiont of Dermanyssus gallinae TaxID=2856608 RepID=UPI001C52FD42|nr:hypothetical protein [Rickettsiella endosymbiont of Dermanyssus gallinae]